MFELRPYVRSNVNAIDPFRGFNALEREFFGGFPSFPEAFDRSLFRSDVTDRGNEYLIETDLPGFKKEDIRLELNGDTLTLHAERKTSSEEKNEKFLRRERSYGSYERSFDVSEVDREAISAEYRDGVLSLTLPKKSEAIPESRQIEIR